MENFKLKKADKLSKINISNFSHGTMNRMHDRMRVVFIVTASLFFFSTFYIAERAMAQKIARDRDAGVVVTKM